LSSGFSNGRIEVTVKDVAKQNRWNSYGVALSSVEQRISGLTNDAMKDEYHLTDDFGDSIDVNSIKNSIDSIVSGDTNIEGSKQFSDWPWINASFPMLSADKYGGDTDNILPNVKKVKKLIENTPVYMSTTDSMVADGNPFGS
jgi:hypothetical protein